MPLTGPRPDASQVLQNIYDEVNNAIQVEGNITTSNPSDGTNGSPAPAQSSQVGGQDPNGNLHALQTDLSGDLKVLDVGGTLTPFIYDNLVVTYVPSGNGAGQTQTVTYKLASATIATLTLSYDSSNRVITVVRS
jgi:hypothetical protein